MMLSDRLSSPSSSSAEHSRPSHPSTAGSSTISDEPHLEITKQPPVSLYSNESFKVDVQLMLPKSSSPPSRIWNCDEPIELTASLHHAKSGKPVQSDEAQVMTKPSKIIIPAPGGTVGGDSNNTTEEDGNGNKSGSTKRSVTVECMIRTDAIRRDVGAAYVVRFRTSGDDSSTTNNDNNSALSSPERRRVVKSGSTRGIKMVNYKIRVTVEEDWEYVWFKDEGGRDKSMEVFVAIYDKDGQLKTGEHIPLETILCYKVDEGDAPPSKVMNQEILRTLGSSKILLDKDTGRARVRFRIEDVSKNHQAQDFLLQIGPERGTKGYKDVASAYTPAVNVRSKRNKRSRGASLPRSATARQSASGVKSHHDHAVSSPPSASRQRLTGSFGGGVGQDAHQGASGNQNIHLNPNKSSDLHAAMKVIIGWADVVVNELYPLQWQVQGYQQLPDGSPDYARPYHNMINPNNSISQILTGYTEQVRGHLRILLNAVEEAHEVNAANVANGGRAAAAASAADYNFASADPYSSLMGTNRFGGGGPGGATTLGAMASETRMRLSGEAGISRAQTVAGIASGQLPPDASDGFRSRAEEAAGALPYQARTNNMTNSMSGSALSGIAGASTYSQASMIPQQSGLRGSHHIGHPQQKSLVADSISREAEVEYVLAKQYKTLRDGTRLGFPAFNEQMEILGFFREGSGKVGVGQFVHIGHHSEDFGPLEILQAHEILRDFIDKGSDSVHRLKDHGTIARLLDAALVYDWSKDMSSGGGASASLQQA
ncbi:MAG: hypothetical protein ACI8RD_005962 [Bacillariaceae sp.]|jgi:hypothetical protein